MSYDSVSRRKVLKASVMAGVGGLLAGCSSQPPNQPGDTSDGAAEVVEPVFDTVHEENYPPDSVNATPLGYWGSEYMRPAMTMYGVNHYSPTADYKGLLVKSSEMIENNKTWRITLSDEGFTWHDGSPVKIQDRLYSEGYMNRFYKMTDGSNDFEEIRLAGENTLDHVLVKPRPAGFFKTTHLPEIFYPRSLMKSWYEKMMDATTSSEAKDINSQLASVKVPLSDLIGHGLFKVEEVGDAAVEYTKHEDHPYADQQNIEKVRVNFFGSKASMRAAYNQDKIDMGTPPKGSQIPSGMESHWYRVTVGEGLMFNQFNKHLAKRGVRRAIAYIVNSKAIVANAGEGFPALHQTGMPTPIEKAWLSDYEDFTGKLIDYSGTQTDKATAAMENAGYSKNGNKWVDADGNPITLSYKTLDYWSAKGRTIASQLRKFGITIDLTQLSDGKYYNTMETANSDVNGGWDILAYELGPGENRNYPATCYSDTPFGLKLKAAGRTNPSSHWAGRPWKVTVPTTVGKTEVTGSGRTLNLLDLQNEFLSVGLNEDRIRKLTETFAWYWNFHVPAIYRSEDQGGLVGDFAHYMFVDLDNSGKPDENDHQLSYGLSTGDLHSKTK